MLAALAATRSFFDGSATPGRATCSLLTNTGQSNQRSRCGTVTSSLLIFTGQHWGLRFIASTVATAGFDFWVYFAAG